MCLYIDKFINHAIKHTESSLEGDYKSGNIEYDSLVKIGKKIKEINEISSLRNLYTHPNLGVQIWAATLTLPYFGEEAKEVLKEIINKDIKHHSFTAKMTLQEWNEGNLIPLI